MGILAGIHIAEKDKKRAGGIAAFVFVITYIPLMSKYVGIVREK